MGDMKLPTICGFDQCQLARKSISPETAIILQWLHDVYIPKNGKTNISGNEYTPCQYNVIKDCFPAMGLTTMKSIARKLIALEKAGILLRHCEKIPGGTISFISINEHEYGLLKTETQNADGPNIKAGYIYAFAFSNGLTKIGISKHLTRHKAFVDRQEHIEQVKYVYSLDMRGAEKIAHRHFAQHRKYGEFFDISFQNACDFIESIVKE